LELIWIIFSKMAAIMNWFFDMLSYLGWYQKNAKILFLGLDNAGKTTLLHMVKDDVLVQHAPTFQPNMEEFTMGTLHFQAWDLGGHGQARIIWESYFTEVDGIFFIIDASDESRFHEAREELNKLLEIEELQRVPFAILGNKIDLPECVSEQTLRHHLGLFATTGKDGQSIGDIRPIEVFMCSIVRRFGYGEAFRWLGKYI